MSIVQCHSSFAVSKVLLYPSATRGTSLLLKADRSNRGFVSPAPEFFDRVTSRHRAATVLANRFVTPSRGPGMKNSGKALTLAVAAAIAQSAQAANDFDRFGNAQHAVFVMTNDADANAIIAYERTPYGTL